MYWDTIVESKLREAFADGLFDDLPGAGKPLRWVEEALVPPDWRAAFHVLRQAGLAPAWIMLDASIREDQQAARQAFARAIAGFDKRDPEYRRARELFAHRLAKINAAIDELNLKVPSTQFARARLDLGLEIGRIRRAGSADPDDRPAESPVPG
jgi:hypothetical protein